MNRFWDIRLRKCRDQGFTRATPSISRYLLRQRSWLAVARRYCV